MADDLDQLIRAAMKTLDDEAPSGYFDALPNRTLTRLEGSMQHGSSGTSETREQVAPPPMTAADSSASAQAAPAASAREEDREDSGLHDIRNLAQSTKQRLSSRRITAPPIEDDVLASSSGSFKNIALPQPAKMVSLPELAELPPVAEVAAADKAAKKAAKEAAKEAAKARTSEPAIAAAAPATTPVEAPAAAPAATAAPVRQAFSLPSQQKKSKGPLIALVGTGLAAAAGVVIFMQVNKSADTAQAPATTAPAAETVAAAPAAAPTVEPIEQPAPPPAPVEPPVEEEKAEPAVAAAAEIAADEADDKNDEKSPKKARAKATKKAEKEETPKLEAAPVEKAPANKADGAKPATGSEAEPSFDALLKEAGVVEKKEAKPKLAKKSLTGSDFKTGMQPVTAKAKACYTGTQGIAMIKLTVAPSGQVSKASVTGAFAGKPEASCVETAVKAATFPPWDGGPQSFTYSVLLSD